MSFFNLELGDLAAGALSYLGQKDANESNLQIAKDQMSFQERMSNTAHQREVLDLRKAGLNPILSAKLGGASTPSGASATMENAIGEGVSTALQARKNWAEVDNMRKSNTLIGAQIDNTLASTAKAEADTRVANSVAKLNDINAIIQADQAKVMSFKGAKAELYEGILDKVVQGASWLGNTASDVWESFQDFKKRHEAERQKMREDSKKGRRESREPPVITIEK